jgi:predicted RNA-binding protein YlxR (DUF448 family)
VTQEAPRRAEPVRTCVGCRQTGGKRDLVRLVRGPDGRLRVDATGKAPGRGAYVHGDPACWATAVGRGGLARALRTPVSPEEASTLRAEIEGAMRT